MARVTFTKATDYLAEQLQSGDVGRRVGVILKASWDSTSDAFKRLEELTSSARQRLQLAVDRQLADLGDDNQRRAVLLSYSGSLRVPVAEQLRLLREGADCTIVPEAAAKQRHVPPEVQEALLIDHRDQHGAMAALASNWSATLPTLEVLASHPDTQVRARVAANVANRMKLVEPALIAQKNAAYNALFQHFDGAMAPSLVPVCKDEDKLAQMYAATRTTPGNARLFVENPYTPERVLLDIATSRLLLALPGGLAVAGDARAHLDKRLAPEREAAAPGMD